MLDDPAVKAMLDWHDRGRLQDEIITEDAPPLTEEQLRQMRPAHFRIGKGRRGS